MPATLAEPAWVGEDCLLMKRAATAAKEAKRVRRVRVPAPDERIKARRDAYSSHLRRRMTGKVRPTLRFAAESAMRKDRGGAYAELRSALEYKGLADEQLMKSTSVTGVDLDTWDLFLRGAAPTARPESPWPRPLGRCSTARTCKRPTPEIWRPTTAYGTLDGTRRRRPGLLEDDATRRDFDIVRPWTPFPAPDDETVEEALYLWQRPDSPELVDFLDRIKPPQPRMRRLRTAPLPPAPVEAPAPAPAWERPDFNADQAFRTMLSDNQKRRVLAADPDAFDEAVVAELRAQFAPEIIEAAAPRGRSATPGPSDDTGARRAAADARRRTRTRRRRMLQ